MQRTAINLLACSRAGLLDFALHLDKHLGQIIAAHGQATYAVLFAIVFAETGFVLTPFLPGDTLTCPSRYTCQLAGRLSDFPTEPYMPSPA